LPVSQAGTACALVLLFVSSESPTPAFILPVPWGALAGFYHGGLMETMAGEATRRIDEFSQQNLANLAWSYAKLAHLDERLMAAVAGALRPALHGAQHAALCGAVLCCAVLCCEASRRTVMATVAPPHGALFPFGFWRLGCLRPHYQNHLVARPQSVHRSSCHEDGRVLDSGSASIYRACPCVPSLPLLAACCVQARP
jgi:hypothetical protein